MRSTSRFWVIAVVLASGCSDVGEPYVHYADCNRSSEGVSFGKVPLGQFSERSVLIRNDGNIDLVGDVTLPAGEFTIVDGAGPFSIPPGGDLRVKFRYAPGDTGFHRADVDFGGDTCSRMRIAGLGTPPPEGPQCVADPPAIAFASTKTGETSERTLELRNPGLIDFNVDVQLIGSGPFEIISGGGFETLDPGDTLRVAIKFAPTTVGNFNAQLAIGSSCDTLAVTGTATPPFTVSFATQIQPIFNNRCITCHDQDPDGQLDLRSGESYANLVNVVSPNYGDPRVLPGDPGASVLYGKVTGDPRFGSLMPATGSPLTLAQRNLIRTWILEGANNN